MRSSGQCDGAESLRYKYFMENDVVRLAYCRRCSTRFGVCRPCDRGQECCCPSCAAEVRRLSLRQIRQRYRHTERGRTAHREQGARRRARIAASAPSAVVGDQGSPIGSSLGALTGLLVVASQGHAIQEGADLLPSEAAPRCSRCCRTARYVTFGTWCPRYRTRRATDVHQQAPS